MYLVKYQNQYLRKVNTIYSLVIKENATLFKTKKDAVAAAHQLNRFSNSFDSKVYLVENQEILMWKTISNQQKSEQ